MGGPTAQLKKYQSTTSVAHRDGKSLITDGFPIIRASYAENAFITSSRVYTKVIYKILKSYILDVSYLMHL